MSSLRIVDYAGITESDRARLFNRRQSLDHLSDTVRDIIAEVRVEGDRALLRFTERFDGVKLHALAVTPDEFRVAERAVDPAVRKALEAQIRHVRAFHSPQVPHEEIIEPASGIRAWREWRPIDRVGLYIPGGRGPYPSSVVMLGVPATIAGCPEITICTPPGPDGTIPPATLVAANLLGIHRVFKIGGAQAIAAMAYGTESVQKVDKVFGAGNAWVTAAKLLAFPDCMLDSPAGPSELLIIADETAQPAWIAADLLSDAEHGPDSAAVLVTTSRELAVQVVADVEEQCQGMQRADMIRQALETCGLVVVVHTLEQAATVADAYAPEHLEIITDRPREVLRGVNNVGSVFLGPYAPNAAGDYATGTNHVLPTALYARTLGAVSVESFGKLIQCQELTPEGLSSLRRTVTTLAREEQLEAHARAVEIRFEGTP